MTESHTGPTALVTSIGTYLPPWGTATMRSPGLDEDAVTMAVAAGLGALQSTPAVDVRRVVLVSRDLPLIEGGNSAALLAGLGLPAGTEVSEVIGGSPAVLDALAGAAPGTLVIGSDAAPAAAAGAVLCATEGASLTHRGRVTRSMPVATRDAYGHSSDYADQRLLRVRGLGASFDQLDDSIPLAAAAGVSARDAKSLCAGSPPALPSEGASAIVFALAALAEAPAADGVRRVLAVEQATLSQADLASGSIEVCRNEAAVRPPAKGVAAPGAEMSIALAAYDRAFDAKLRLEAARCRACGTLSYPHRLRCLECGSEEPTDAVALPRDAEVYTLSTIHVPVPGLVSPYTVVVAELGDTGVRLLVRLTGAAPGSVHIGDRGRLVFRLVATRSGVPDYGYGFLPITEEAA